MFLKILDYYQYNIYMVTSEIKNKFVELRAKSYSFDKIAIELSVSKQTLINWSKELKLEIGNLRALEEQCLKEKYYLDHKGKIEAYGSIIKKAKEELDKRSFENIPTDKLIDIIVRLKSLYDPSEQFNHITHIETDSFKLSYDREVITQI